MSKQTNKYILLFGLFVTIATSLGFLAPKPVEAGGGGAGCFILVQAGYYRKMETCPSDPSIDASRAVCYYQPDSAQRSGSTTFSVVDCGTVVQKNNECVASSCYPGATTDGTGSPSNNSKNNESASNSPEPITDAERQALADCGSNGESAQACLSKNPLVKWTLYAINFLAAGVGVVVTIMIIIGGIQYASAGPNPQQVQAAKKKIANALIALVAFFFLYAFMQYLVPGGIF